MSTDARSFLEALWPLDVPDGSKLVLSYQAADGGGVRNAGASSIEEALLVLASFPERANVWLNIAARHEGAEARGRTEDLTEIPALWCDLDVAEGADETIHKGGATFATYAEAKTFLKAFPLQPSMVVRTGYGLSAWWILAESEPAVAAVPVLAALKATVMRLSDGRTDPAVYDTARMMRLPGTSNWKRPATPVPCTILHQSGSLYSLTDLAEVLDLPPVATQEPASRPQSAPGGTGRPGDDYDAQATTDGVVALLLEHGATITRELEKEGRRIVWLTRPGKDSRHGPSMTVGFVGPAVCHMFSSGWDQLPPDTYKPYRLYAALVHGGDWLAAARALAALGYGAHSEPLAKLPELNDTAIARDVATWMDDQALHVEGIGWHLWDGRRYITDPERHVLTLRVMDYADALVARAKLDMADAEHDGEEAMAAAKKKYGLASTWLNRPAQVRLMDNLAALLHASSESMDADQHLLNVGNGVVDLRTGDLSPHATSHRMTRLAEADYDPQTWSQDWTQALSALSEDVADWLQMAAGMSAAGIASSDRIFVTFGNGGNGKTTLLGTIHHVLGSYGATIPAKMFTAEGTNQTQLLMPLRGARMALAAETGEDHYLNMERLKALSGGDSITDRHLYSRSFATWRPSHTLWLMTNHRPRVKNKDEGTWRRLVLVPFGQSFRGAPDATLRDRLKEDPANRGAVLAWLVRGSVRWFKAGRTLRPCDDVAAATEGWRDDEDSINGYVAEHYEVTGGRDDSVGAAELYEHYRMVTESAGMRPLSAPNLKTELESYAERLRSAHSRTFAQGRVKAGIRWFGLRKLSETNLPEFNPLDTERAKDPWD